MKDFRPLDNPVHPRWTIAPLYQIGSKPETMADGTLGSPFVNRNGVVWYERVARSTPAVVPHWMEVEPR